MTDKELRKLNRAELLELLIETLKENEDLRQSKTALEEKLAEREIRITQSGTMAEAALKLNEVFEAADKACAQYLENVRLRQETDAATSEDGTAAAIDSNL